MKVRLVWALSGALAAVSAPLFAQDRGAPSRRPQARLSAADGAFATYSLPARVGSGGARLRVGYDSSAGRADVLGEAAAPVTARFSLRAGAAYDALSSAARPFALAQLAVLDQSDAPLSLALVGGVQSRGFNGGSQAELGVAAARRFGSPLLLASARYGQAFTSHERNGSLSFATLLTATPDLQLGVDSQFECDLERDSDEPEREPDFRIRGGPLLSFTHDMFAFSAGGGVTAMRYRLAPPLLVGALAYLGMGAVF